MTQKAETVLGPPPRKAYARRAVRNMRRAYGTIFALVILVFGGWAALDAIRWAELGEEQRMLAVGFGFIAALAVVVHQFVSHPLRRELRLARRGATAQAEIVSVGRKRNRRATQVVVYRFQTSAGVTIEGSCVWPRRLSLALAPGQVLEVLYLARKPAIHKPRLALQYVEFGDPHKKPGGPD
jgi:hypothetical protein